MLLQKLQILCFLGILVQLGISQNLSKNYSRDYNYITWDDIKVDEFRDSVSKTEIKGKRNWNDSGIIVVDQSGKTGDSITVQGAVDMVPFGNSQRFRILILPGIYR